MITEILYGTVGEFTADNTKDHVDATIYGSMPGYKGVPCASQSGDKFSAGDNITLLSVGLSISTFFQIARYTGSSSPYYAPAIPFFITLAHGAAGTSVFSSYMQFSPFENAINQYLGGLRQSAFSLNIGVPDPFHPPKILTAAAPAIYNGQIFHIEVFAKVQHSIEMTY